MGKLKDKVAIVTGSGRSIGRAIAIAYAREGAKVVVASLTPGRCDETVKLIKAAGGEAFAQPSNVGIREQVYAMVEAAIQKYGRLDILVNNAQAFGTQEHPTSQPVPTPFEDFDEDVMEWTFRTGAMATFWGMKAAFPHLKKQGGGKIINFGSYWGVSGQPGTVAYNTTKEAIRGMSRTAAREWGTHKITVNVINPAGLSEAVAAVKEAHPEIVAGAEQKMPLGRFGDNDKDIAPIAVFLASSDSDYLTGMTFSVDGGLDIRP